MATLTPQQQAMFPLIEEWELSNTTRKDFLIKHNMSDRMFSYWLKKYRQLTNPEPGFIALRPYSSPYSTPSSVLTIRYPNGVEVQLPSHPDVSTLKTLVGLFT